MKNLQKGFIIPAMIAIVLILTISGGTYVYLESKKTDIVNNKTTTSEDNPIVSTSSEVKVDDKIVNQSTSSAPNIIDTSVVTKKKDGIKTVTKTATSTTSTFIGNDGSKFSTTYSKEEEEYMKKNTIYSCGNETCFNESVKNCTPVTMTTADLGFLGKLFYEIKPKASNVCTLTFKYLAHLNPEYVGKGMTCEINNKLGFEDASAEMYSNATLKGNPSNCSGSFYEDIKYKPLPPGVTIGN